MEIKTGIYKHFKGRKSLVFGTAKHSDDDSVLVLYKGLQDGQFYARPYNSFVELVSDAKGNKVPRFSLVKEIKIDLFDTIKEK